ncbi:MAG: flavin reductase family protein [Prevotellaceae bacterium]|jgi:flavin reductase (DIM6/NTAB) family NADH-FMN oxidoreductase RutF|nr:flavin reductase family protein [Prevotellaceae bacterium]
MERFKDINIMTLTTSPVRLVSKVWMLVTAGTADSFNSMTASWGGMGFIWQCPAAFIFVRPQRYTLEFIEREQSFTLSFFDHDRYRAALNLMGGKSGRDMNKANEAGLTPLVLPSGRVAYGEAQYIIECKTMYSDRLKPENFIDDTIPARIYPKNDFHRTFIAEITRTLQNKEAVPLFRDGD